MSTPPPIPNVQQNAPVPTGNIPASRRQWIAVGACLLLVVAIAFTSLGGPASPKLRTNPLPSATVTPMTAAELDTATRNLKQQQIEAEEARQKADQAAKRFAQSVSPTNAAPGGAVDSNLQGGVSGQPVIGPNGGSLLSCWDRSRRAGKSAADCSSGDAPGARETRIFVAIFEQPGSEPASRTSSAWDAVDRRVSDRTGRNNQSRFPRSSRHRSRGEGRSR